MLSLLKNEDRFREDDLEKVIAACLAHNSKAQKTLIKTFYSFAKSVSLRYAGNSMEAEEILDDGFLKVFKNLDKYDHSQPFKGWLRSIMVNTAIDHYRKNLKYAGHVELDHDDIADFSRDVISKISAEEILEMVQRLPPSYRMVFQLYVVEGYNHREIAELLGIREGTSKSNLQDARKKLQQMIKNSYPDMQPVYGFKIQKVQ